MHLFRSIDEVLELHAALIERYGGAHGLRDEGASASAIMRPQLGYYDGLLEEAAALMESLALNHAFIDGNKRIAYTATDTFLRLNGHFIDAINEDAYAFFMDLFESNSFRFVNLLPWLEEHVKPLP